MLWLLLIFVVLHLLRKKMRAAAALRRTASEFANRTAANSSDAADAADAADAVGATEPTAAIETMVPCAHCGVYVPQSESVPVVQGVAFCSEAHRRLHSPS